MSEVETRRFRTWDQESEVDPSSNWRIILKYGIVRMLQAWHMRLLLVLALIYAVTLLGTYSYALTDIGAGPTGGDLLAAAGGAIAPTIVFLLFVAAPLFSEDVRFNAPLFYFSKPVSPRDYIVGKGALVVGTLSLVVLVPLFLFLLLTLAGAVLAEPVDWDGSPLDANEMEEWELTHVNSAGDWAYVVAVMVPGFVVFIIFLTSLFLMMSAWTQRAWHAAIGSVTLFGAWSILGLTMSEISRSAYGSAFGPLGWAELLIFSPVEARFGWWQVWQDNPPRSLTNLEGAIPLAYIFTLATTVIFLAATHYKLRRLEGML